MDSSLARLRTLVLSHVPWLPFLSALCIHSFPCCNHKVAKLRSVKNTPHLPYKHHIINSSNLPLPKSNLNAVFWRQNNLRLKLSSAVLPVFADSVEALKYPYNRITYISHQHTPCSWILGGFDATYPSQSMQIAVQHRSSVHR